MRLAGLLVALTPLLLSQVPPLERATIGDLQLDGGATLKDCLIAYRTWGQPNADRSNIVLFPSFFNGNTDDLAQYVKPGSILDPAKYYIIAADALGNGYSASPSNYDPARGQAFPRITIHDMVNAHHRLLTQVLKIDRVDAIVGISMGGMQAYEWLVRYPGFARRAVTIVATPRMSERDIALWAKAFPLGRREGPPKSDDADASRRPATNPNKIWGAIEAVFHQIPKVRQPFNPLRQFEALSRHDISLSFNRSLEQAGQRIQIPVLTIVALKDQALSPQTPIEFARARNWPVVELDDPSGHAAFKGSAARIGQEIDRFLSQR